MLQWIKLVLAVQGQDEQVLGVVDVKGRAPDVFDATVDKNDAHVVTDSGFDRAPGAFERGAQGLGKHPLPGLLHGGPVLHSVMLGTQAELVRIVRGHDTANPAADDFLSADVATNHGIPPLSHP